MQVKENELDTSYKPWTDEEDKLMIEYKLQNKTSKEIGVLLNKSEFVIDLRIHLLIYRLHRNGYTPAQIRLIMNEELSHILDIIKPVPARNQIRHQETVWWADWVSIWNTICNSF